MGSIGTLPGRDGLSTPGSRFASRRARKTRLRSTSGSSTPFSPSGRSRGVLMVRLFGGTLVLESHSLLLRGPPQEIRAHGSRIGRHENMLRLRVISRRIRISSSPGLLPRSCSRSRSRRGSILRRPSPGPRRCLSLGGTLNRKRILPRSSTLLRRLLHRSELVLLSIVVIARFLPHRHGSSSFLGPPGRFGRRPTGRAPARFRRLNFLALFGVGGCSYQTEFIVRVARVLVGSVACRRRRLARSSFLCIGGGFRRSLGHSRRAFHRGWRDDSGSRHGGWLSRTVGVGGVC